MSVDRFYWGKTETTTDLTETPEERRLRVNLIPGMAYFAGTCDRPGEYCGRCGHFRPRARPELQTDADGRLAMVDVPTGKGICAKAAEALSKPPLIHSGNHACKYHTPKGSHRP